MEYEHTDEQEAIISAIVNAEPGTLIKVEAVAGASKTYTLVESALEAQTTNGLYLSFNKANAVEAAQKFPKVINCSTTHSLAYGPIITHGLDREGETGPKRSVDWFSYKSIKEKISYDEKLTFIAALDDFFLSDSIDYITFFHDTYPDLQYLAERYIEKMWAGTIPCTHSAYLKFYHILLETGCIHYDPEYDLIMLDEAGDINRVTLAIFMALPAKVKVIVGDSQQNIYSFNNTVNAFTYLKGQGTTYHLSQSFRCSVDLAVQIEQFGQVYLDDNFIFKGTDHTDTSIRTEAIISRSNSGLIGHMIELVNMDEPFNLVRPAKEIFAVALMLAALSSKSKIFDSRYKHLVDDAKTFEKHQDLQIRFKGNLLSYIDHLYGDVDISIKSAVSTIRQYRGKTIFSTYEIVKQYEKSREHYPITLTTAHSSKGFTFDQVTITDDFRLDEILVTPRAQRSNAEQEELRLYYVACSRAKHKLIGAKYLDINYSTM